MDHGDQGTGARDSELEHEHERQTTSQIVRALDHQLRVKHMRRNILFAILLLTSVFALGAVIWPAFTSGLPEKILSYSESRRAPERPRSVAATENQFKEMQRIEDLAGAIRKFRRAPDAASRKKLLADLRKQPKLGVAAVAQLYALEPRIEAQAELVALSGEVGGAVAQEWQLGLAARPLDPVLRHAVVRALARTRRPGVVAALARLYLRAEYAPDRPLLRDLIVALADQRDLEALRKMGSAELAPIDRAVAAKLAGRKALLDLAGETDTKKLQQVLDAPGQDWAKLHALRRLEAQGDSAAVERIAAAARVSGKRAPDTLALNATAALVRLAERSPVAREKLAQIIARVEDGPGRAALGQLLARYGKAAVRRLLEDHCKKGGVKWAEQALARIAQRDKAR